MVEIDSGLGANKLERPQVLANYIHKKSAAPDALVKK